MDDLELLLDDHSLLSSQVVHVTALVRTLEQDTSVTSPLCSEISRQVEILRQQLLEHFAFEEAQAFPRLQEKFPHVTSDLQELGGQHAVILDALDAVQTALKANPEPAWPELIAHCDTFGAVFTDHAADEAALLAELTSTPK